jgi:hypothetical protein
MTPLLLLAEAAFTWPLGSYVRLQPTDQPGAVAEIEFKNQPEHATATLEFTLTLDGLDVAVTAEVGNGMAPDTLTVTPPDGYFAVPEVLSVDEGKTDRLLIYSIQSVGF